MTQAIAVAPCPERGDPNECSKCGQQKPCNEMQTRRGLPHGHTPTICRRCRNRQVAPAPTWSECVCGRQKRSHSVRCRACWNAERPSQSPKRRTRQERVLTSDGYIKRWAPDHPNAQHSGHVYEHRWAMEQVLGRYLLPAESVHHIDGDRTNNDPVNLELWIAPQPTGVRIEDAVAQAVELLRVHAPHLLVEETHELEHQRPEEHAAA